MSNYYSDGVYQPLLDPTFQNAQHQQQQYYQIQLPRLYITTPEQSQPWNASQRPRIVPQRPQSVQDTRDHVHSPATSVHTAQTTSDALVSDRIVYRQPDLSRTNNRISLSQQNSPYMLSPTYASIFDPSAREEPWSSFHTRSAENRRVHCPSRQSNAEFPQYQYPRVASDIDSSVQPSDSGYMSYGTSQSVLGNESDVISHSLPQEFVNGIGGMNVESEAGSVTAGSRVPSDQTSHIGSTRSRKSTSMPIKCDYSGCTETFKCKSEHKKHKRKHEKPFRCTEPDCKRHLEGFTTMNDLDRHRKSVHQIDVRSNSYKCVGKNCRNKEKVWPRLDNFKQHVKHMHPNEDTVDVIERSKLHSDKQPSFVDDESTVAHMGASLVLNGMDKSLPSYPVMASSSPVEPPMKRYQQDRSSIDLNSEAMKEERRKLRFLNETSFATPFAHHQEQPAQRRAPGLSSAKQTPIPLPSDISMNPPLGKNTSQVSQSNVDYGLSNAPQTKAEQQRMARKRSVATPSPTGPADIGHILSMLQQASSSVKQDNEPDGKASSTSSDPDAIMLSKRDAMELVKLLEAAQAATRRGDKPRQRTCPYSGCGQTVARACDMRKHLKRHEKPYGCTYPKCYKRFGAKSDWKRHENNQHFQPEAFRCVFETSPGTVCGDHSHQLEMYEVHLKAHSITSSRVAADLTKRSKIGKNCQETFWCGFCKAIVPLRTRRNDAWDERFDHIAHHLEKGKKSIEEWICVEQNRPKKELKEEQKRATRGVEDDKDKDDESESVGDDEESDDLLPQWTPMLTIPEPPPPSFNPEKSRKREAPSDTDSLADRQTKQKRRRNHIPRFCCSCHNGPYGLIQDSCIECTHILCGNCFTSEEFLMELYE